MESMWIVVGVFLILTVVLYMGKGAFLIAGYNTSSKAEKAKIDEKKLCHVMGNGLLIITILLIAQILLEDVLPTWLFWGMVAIDILYILIASNTRCKRNPSLPVPETSKSSKGLSKGASLLIGLVTIVIVVFFLLSENVSVETTASKLVAKALFVTTTEVAYKDIKKIELKEDLELGSRTNGLGDFKVRAGHFKNDAYGRYMLYSYNDCKTYIVITMKDQSIVVVNEKTAQETKKLYTSVQNKLNEG